MQKKKRKMILFFSLLFFLLMSYIGNPLPSLSYILEDLLFQHTSQPNPAINVIGIDEKSLEALGPWNNWSRSNMADMIRLLNEDADTRPAVIGVDVLYLGATVNDYDLIDAVSLYDNVIFASQLQFNTALRIAEKPGEYRLDKMTVQGISLPQKPLDNISENGFTNVFLDSDGIVRRSVLSASVDGKQFDSFPYSIAKKYTTAVNKKIPHIRTDKKGLWTIPYTASTGSYQKGISFIDVINGDIPASYFQDSIVLIGATASGMMDSYPTPISRNLPMPGVELNANMTEAILDGYSLLTIPAPIQLITLTLLFICCFFLYYHENPFVRGITLFVSTLGWFAFTAASARIGFLWNTLYFPLSSLILFIVRIIVDYLFERHERLLTLETFERYVSPEVARHLLSAHEQTLDAIQETRKHIAVLFVDIRGFTPLSENMPPEAVADILNQYLTLTSTAVLNQNGTVDKFIGDAMMALFNAPADLDDYVYRAVRSAMDIFSGENELNRNLEEKYNLKISIGIGIHCGEAMVGSIGAPFRMEYTAIGDTVNTASRLQSIAAPGQILVSQAVCDTLKDRLITNYLDTRQLKGKEEPFPIYEVSSLLS